MNTQLQKLFQTRMDRKAFLRHVGLGFIAMTGVAALLKTLQGVDTQSQPQSSADQALAYGGGAYGGAKKPQA